MARLVTRLASISSSISSSVWARALQLSVVVALAGGCAPDDVEHLESRTRAVTAAGADPGNLDILFMIDNSSSMTEIQQKLLTQDPSFMTVLQNLPNGLPNIHVAVVSSDMGAPGDSTSSIMCTTAGDNGLFQSTPRGTCTSTTLTSGATFISNVGGVANYTGNLTDVFGCIAQLGQTRLRVRESARLGGARPRRRRRAAADEQRRVLARRRRAGDRAAHQRGRLLGPAEHHALLAQRRPAERGQPAGADRQLPLQPVRPPLHRSRQRDAWPRSSRRRSILRPTRR